MRAESLSSHGVTDNPVGSGSSYVPPHLDVPGLHVRVRVRVPASAITPQGEEDQELVRVRQVVCRRAQARVTHSGGLVVVGRVVFHPVDLPLRNRLRRELDQPAEHGPSLEPELAKDPGGGLETQLDSLLFAVGCREVRPEARLLRSQEGRPLAGLDGLDPRY